MNIDPNIQAAAKEKINAEIEKLTKNKATIQAAIAALQTSELPEVKKIKNEAAKLKILVETQMKEIPVKIKWAIGNPLSFAKAEALVQINKQIKDAANSKFEAVKNQINGMKDQIADTDKKIEEVRKKSL